MKMTTDRAIAGINEILAALEQDTGCVVKDAGLQRIDVTTHGDSIEQHRISATIELQRLPAHSWAT